MESEADGKEPSVGRDEDETIGIYESQSKNKKVVVTESEIKKAKEICISLLGVIRRMDATTQKAEFTDLSMEFSTLRDRLNEIEL